MREQEQREHPRESRGFPLASPKTNLSQFTPLLTLVVVAAQEGQFIRQRSLLNLFWKG